MVAYASFPLPTRDAIVATAGESIARGSQSFAMASRLFDRKTRERAWLLYAWCRRCDDLADGQDHGGTMAAVEDPAERLALIADRTERALAGEIIGEPAFDALRIVAADCRIPPALPRDLVQGFAMDAADWRPRSEDDLLTYCYHVAGAVGVMMAIVMGVDPDDRETLDRACDLGLAFQLANIARDVAEDAAGGRCYLPLDWLTEFDIPPGEHMKPPYRARLAIMSKRLADSAEAYEASARIGATRLPFRARWAVLAAAGIYGDIARTVRARGEHAWDHRVVVGKASKLGWVLRAYVQARGKPGASVKRDGLWTRPVAG
jgi:phytoene synthase